MSLTKKAVGLGTILLMSTAGAQPNETVQQKRARLEQEKKEACEQIVEKHKPKLKGNFWGLGKGCLDNFKPKKAGKNNYFNAFSCVNDFLTEYNSKKCDKKEPLYLDSLEAMLTNLKTTDPVAKFNINSALRKEGFLDYLGQLTKSAKAAEEAKKQAEELAKNFSLLRPGAEQKQAQDKIASWQNYLENLKIQAYLIPYIALQLRETPKQTSEKGIDSKRIKGLMRCYAALSDLTAIGIQSDDPSSWYQAYNSFLSWKKNHEKMYQEALSILDHGLDYGEFKTGEGDKWKEITYLDTKGKPQVAIATKEFGRMWGANGENFYEPIETIDDILGEVNKIKNGIERAVKLTSAINELNKRLNKSTSRKRDDRQIVREIIRQRKLKRAQRRKQKRPVIQTEINSNCMPRGINKGNLETITSYFGLQKGDITEVKQGIQEWNYSGSDPTAIYYKIRNKLINKTGKRPTTNKNVREGLVLLSIWELPDCFYRVVKDGFGKVRLKYHEQKIKHPDIPCPPRDNQTPEKAVETYYKRKQGFARHNCKKQDIMELYYRGSPIYQLELAGLSRRLDYSLDDFKYSNFRIISVEDYTRPSKLAIFNNQILGKAVHYTVDTEETNLSAPRGYQIKRERIDEKLYLKKTSRGWKIVPR